MDLKPYIQEINDLRPLEQRIYFKQNDWVDSKHKKEEISKELDFIVENYQNGISRNEIILYFAQKDNSLLIGFLMTMIWGHGFSEIGKVDNRGPWKVSKMFTNFEESKGILEKAKDNLKVNNLIGSHQSFDKMERCRVNYFSKYLYF